MPGDARGHVSNVRHAGGGFTPKRNTPGTPCAAGDEYTRALAQAVQSHPTILLTRGQAECVVRTLVEVARKKGWRVLRAAVMANHVHSVTIDCPNDGPLVRRVWKGVTQAALNEFVGHPARWWTAGGSDRYKNDDAAIESAVNYVAGQAFMLAGVDDMRAFVTGDERRG
jgi:REP element-mobilizing transposase RayT